MTQLEYTRRLEKNLKGIPAARKAEILEDIQAHFEEGAQAGMSEDALCASLGDAAVLAKEYRATVAMERAEQKSSAGNVMRAIWAGIGMGMLNLIFVLPIAAALFAVWIALAASSIAMALTGFVTTLASLVNAVVPLPIVEIPNTWFGVFAGLAVCALGLLLGIGMVYASRALGSVVVKYIKANVEIIAGRRKENA